jgi:hypothetical protein
MRTHKPFSKRTPDDLADAVETPAQPDAADRAGTETVERPTASDRADTGPRLDDAAERADSTERANAAERADAAASARTTEQADAAASARTAEQADVSGESAGRHASGDAPGGEVPTEPTAVGVARPVPPQDSVPGEEKLLGSAVSARFEARWRDVQAGFVDDPAAAVKAAGDLLDELCGEVTAAVRSRRDSLSITDSNVTDQTEQRRTRLRAYRELVNQLLHA